MKETENEKPLNEDMDSEKKPSWYNKDLEEIKEWMKKKENLEMFNLIDKSKTTQKKLDDYHVLIRGYELYKEKRTYSNVSEVLEIGKERAKKILNLYKSDKKRWRKK